MAATGLRNGRRAAIRSRSDGVSGGLAGRGRVSSRSPFPLAPFGLARGARWSVSEWNAAVVTRAVEARGTKTVSTTLRFFFDRFAFLPATPVLRSPSFGRHTQPVCHPHAVTVYLVGAGPGDPGLITVRGAE